jgi:hypothetical protein
MIDEIKRLEQEALDAETWIHVPESVLATTLHNEQFWLLHHTHVPKIIATLPGEFAHIASVLHTLLATGIKPNYDTCFVDKTWLVSIHRADGTGRLTTLEEELACGLMAAMANTLDTGVLSAVDGFRQDEYPYSPVTEWIETMVGQERSEDEKKGGLSFITDAPLCHEESDCDLDLDVWGEALR